MKKTLKFIEAMRSIAIIVITAVTVFVLASCDNPSNPLTIEPVAVDIAAIQGVTAPVTGGTPVTAIETAQYTGTVTWEPAVSDAFEPATQYTATITLTAKKGYTLQGIEAGFFTVEGSITTSSDADPGVITVVFPSTAGTAEHPVIIDITEIGGIAVPTTGGTPVTVIETAQYTGTVTWEPAVSGVFESNTEYTATIILTAKTGYTLQGIEAGFFTVEGSITTSSDADSGVITVVFPSTAGTTEHPAIIDITEIGGIAVPVTGGIPVTVIETAQYTGTVTWDPPVSGTFAADIEYTATITLTAKTGYTLQGIEADFFTVEGSITTSSDADSGVVIVVFPSTAGTAEHPAIIDITEIGGVAVPATGGTPVTALETAQYTGTITWDPDHSTFAPATQYTATITLTAKTGYTLQGIEDDFFTVDGAVSVSYDADSGVITAAFLPTAATVSTAAIVGVTAPVTGGTPVTTITETAQYTGTVTWNPDHPAFASATEYTATITLTAKTGYTLTGVEANLFTVAGATVSYDAASGVITAAFPRTATTVDIAAIAGVTAPATGGTPVTTITETAQYTGTITWSPDVPDTFAAGTAYTATITLKAKTGYTLQGVTANFFTVAGAAPVSNIANSGVVTVVFPETEMPLVAMVWVPGGSFVMGNNGGNDKFGNRIYPHTVTLTGFYIGMTEITQAQYLAVMGVNPSQFISDPADGEVQEKRPVERVSWYDAIEFCNALSEKEGLSAYYTIDKVNQDPNNESSYDTYKWTVTRNISADGYRLPTEAQWEYAAKGGDGSPGGYTYAGSNNPYEVAWFDNNVQEDGTSFEMTHEVGKKKANGLGLYDMSGNVHEWCWDWHGSYTSEAQTDPIGASSSSPVKGYRVLRGGTFSIIDYESRVENRLPGNPSSASYNVGFRVVRP